MKRTSLLIIVLWTLSLFGICNNNESDLYERHIENYISTQAWAFRHYGDANTNLYTGTMTQEIPIYTIKDEDFNVPISLRYISDAFKPADHVELYGQNWSINAGGCITREVRGLPDDELLHEHHFEGAPFEPKFFGNVCHPYRQGFLSFCKQNQLSIDYVLNFANYERFDGKNNCTSVGPYSFSNNILKRNYFYTFKIAQEIETVVDYMPDIYHFNFCGYHGSFTFNNKGQVIIIDGDFVDIDVSKLGYIPDEVKLHDIEKLKPTPSTITITTKDGYQYIFGGTDASIEYNIDLNSVLQDAEYLSTIEIARERNIKTEYNIFLKTPCITSWHLTSIVAPNRRKVSFSYKNNVKLIPSQHYSQSPQLVSRALMTKEIEEVGQWEAINFETYAWVTNFVEVMKTYHLYIPHFVSWSAAKIAVIDDIKVDNFKIDFTHHEVDLSTDNEIVDYYSYFGNTPEQLGLSYVFPNCIGQTWYRFIMSNYKFKTPQLKGIDVYYNDTKRLFCELSYDRLNGRNYFLTNVNIDDTEYYKMEYNCYKPLLASRGLILPSDLNYYDYLDIFGKQVAVNYCVSPSDGYRGYYDDPTYSDWGTLKKITFPTGGYQIFEYIKGHKYSKTHFYKYKIKKLPQNFNFPFTLYTKNYSASKIFDDYHLSVWQNKDGIVTGTPVKSIKTYDKNNMLVQLKNYNYINGVFYDYSVYVDNGHNGLDVDFSSLDQYKQLVSDIGYAEVDVQTTEYLNGKEANFSYEKFFYQIDSIYPSDRYNLLKETMSMKYFNASSPFAIRTNMPTADGAVIPWLRTAQYGFNTWGYAYDPHLHACNSSCFDGSFISPKGGKLLRHIIYDSKGKVVKDIENKWTTNKNNPDTFAIYNFNNYLCAALAIARLYFINPIVLKQQKTTEYAPDGKSITTTTNYSYDDKHRIKELTTTDNNQILTKQFTYPDQIHPGSVQILDLSGNGKTISMPTPLPYGIQYLIKNNLIDQPVEILTLSEKGIIAAEISIPYYVNPIKRVANDPTRIDKTKYVYKLQLSEPIKQSNYQPLKGNSSGGYVLDPNYKLTYIYDFNADNRLIKITPTGQIPTYLTWQNNYLTQKQTGKLITKYTYLPFIGISSITDERGVTTYYAYDSFGRLKEIYRMNNGRKEILQAYSYHYNNQ